MSETDITTGLEPEALPPPCVECHEQGRHLPWCSKAAAPPTGTEAMRTDEDRFIYRVTGGRFRTAAEMASSLHFIYGCEAVRAGAPVPVWDEAGALEQSHWRAVALAAAKMLI